MAESKDTMARLERLERDSSDVKRTLGRITSLLVDHSERFDIVGARIDRLSDRVDQLGDRVDQLGDRLSERLDRLIAVSIQERTHSVERLMDIERRLEKLEKRFDS
ncbi:MAG TPA: hypothetical protein VGM29_01025 [Polyangiaceae bacterium]